MTGQKSPKLQGIWESEFGFLQGFFFANFFARHCAGLSPASRFNPAKNPAKETKRDNI
jgi:hypothetical protein